ncbi:MAG: hypothetical protein K2X11_15475 [Acetobacteraceae bacterium]|nr:hypothetical protein [Acetobacteraceae bacterium]
MTQVLDDSPAAWTHRRGDLVRLVRDETGEDAMGRMGDWGAIEEVEPDGAVTVKIAGFSRPAHADIVRLCGVPRGLVEPCDARGRPTRKRRPPTAPAEAPMRPRGPQAPPPPPASSGAGVWAVGALTVMLVAGAVALLYRFGGP